MEVLVPYDAVEPKTRLAPVLDEHERHRVARAALRDVCAAIREAGEDLTVLSTGPVDLEVPVQIDERPLTPAVNDAIASHGGSSIAVVMADLPLARPATVEEFLSTAGDLVLAPGRGGGTNGLVVRESRFRVDFHGASIRDHRAIARELDLTPTHFDSFRLSTDLDEPQDLSEVLLHGEGRTATTLADLGFRIAAEDGRVTVRREGVPADG